MSTESNPLLRELADPALPELIDKLERMAANSNAAPTEEEKQRSLAAIRHLLEASEDPIRTEQGQQPVWKSWLMNWFLR